VGEKK